MLRERRSNANISQSTVHKPKRREGSLPESRESTQLTINFTGDVESNISGIVDCLECSVETRTAVRDILRIYAGKVNKLREERNYCREMLRMMEERESREQRELREEIDHLRQELSFKQKESQFHRCTCIGESDVKTEKYQVFEEEPGITSHVTVPSKPRPKESSPNVFVSSAQASQVEPESRCEETEEQLLVGSSLQSQCVEGHSGAWGEQTASISEEELTRLMVKYNISLEEL